MKEGYDLQVEVLWHCAEAKLEGSITMKRHKGPAPLYIAPWKSEVSCGPPTGAGGANVISLQVKWRSIPHVDISELVLPTCNPGASCKFQKRIAVKVDSKVL